MRPRLAALLVALVALLAAPAARASSGVPSAWDAPQLTSPQTIQISESNRNLKLDQTKDYILTCPSNPVVTTYTLVVWGGRNVELDGCNYQNNGYTDSAGTHHYSGGAQFKNQTGTLWLHDVRLSGSLIEGIDLQEPGTTTVVLRDVLMGSAALPLAGSFASTHADCLQTWSGPQRLLIDGLTCFSGYQGFFLLPNQHDSTIAPTVETVWDFRHINLHLSGAYAFTFGGPFRPDFNVEHVYVDGAANEPRLYQGGQGFEDAQAGVPPIGDYAYPSSSGLASGVDEGVDPMPSQGERP